MKRLFVILIALVLCCTAGLADETPTTPFLHSSGWNGKDIDVSGVQEVNGRLVGTVKLPATTLYGRPTAELRVDCPLPEGFTAEQSVTLHVERRFVTARELASTMGTLGYSFANGKFTQYNGGVETVVSYTSEPNIDHGYYHAQLCDVSLSDDPAFAAEYTQAKAVVRNLMTSLVAVPAERVFHANRLDAVHSDHYSLTESSTAAEESARRRVHFEESEGRNGRAESSFTMVRGLYELYDLPVMDQFFYLKGGDWIGASSEFRAAVRDDGTLGFVEISGLPVVTGVAALDLPAFDWRTLLKQAVANLCATNASPVDEVSEDGRVVYAGYSVITAIKPCWVGMTEDTLVPGWYCVTEQRVAKDDSVAAVWALYADARTLMSP